MPTRSGHANPSTLERTPPEDSVTVIDHITGARCVLLHRVRALLSTIDRAIPSHPVACAVQRGSYVKPGYVIELRFEV